MKVRLHRNAVIRLYYYLWEAERSVDAALWADWREFQEYYTDEKRASLRLLVSFLLDALGLSVPECRWTGEAIVTGSIRWRQLLPPPLARILARQKVTWSFHGRELAFMAVTLQSLLDLLVAEKKPAMERLRILRIDIYDCELVIHGRCRGMSEVNRPPRRYHFMQAEHITPAVVDPDPELKLPA